VYDRPAARPGGQDALAADDPGALPRPRTGGELRAALLALLASPSLADKTWVTQQYDRHVRGDTVLAMPEDAGMIRVDEETGLGVALATDGNGRYCRLDPYAGTQLALAEAYRNVAATGARPVAVTNCLNFGSPEDPGVMWQFAEAVRGLADGCARLGTPVTGGNVSFYNQTGEVAIHPTPVVGVLGVLDDVRRRVPIGFSRPGARLVLLGTTRAEFGGSAWAQVVHGHLGGRPPIWMPNELPRGCSPRRRGPACWTRPTTSPTAGSPSPWPSPAWPAGTAAGSACRAMSSRSCSASRRRGWWSR
jgi:phosphoribosylformylglycinamidine (FGAM) synthase-like enzyme